MPVAQSRLKLILFDFDGVLIDSLPVMRTAWASVQKNFAVTQPFEEYSKHIGRPFECILDKLGVPKQKHLDIFNHYSQLSQENSNQVRLMPAVHGLLGRLRDINLTLGLVTSKDSTRTHSLIKQFQLSFSIVVTPESVVNGKPHPDPINYCLSQLNFCREETLFVGDMKTDMQCAKSARVRYLHYLPGYESLQFTEYGGVIGHHSELLEYIRYFG